MKKRDKFKSSQSHNCKELTFFSDSNNYYKEHSPSPGMYELLIATGSTSHFLLEERGFDFLDMPIIYFTHVVCVYIFMKKLTKKYGGIVLCKYLTPKYNYTPTSSII